MGNFISEVRMIFHEELRNIIKGKTSRLNGDDLLNLFTLRNSKNVRKQGGENINLKEVTIF